MPGRPLPLEDQLDYTNGLCAPFALAARDLLGGSIRLLYCADDRQFEQHDWPPSVPLCLHVFLELPSGTCLDAEGERPLVELLRSFGVRRGYGYDIVSDADGEALKKAFPGLCHDSVEVTEVTALIMNHGWNDGAPRADGTLSRNYKTAKKLSYERHLRRLREAKEADHAESPSPSM